MAENRQTGLQTTAQPVVTGPGEQALAMLSTLRQRFAAMPAKKRTWLIASLVFLAAACAGMAWFAQRPDWRILFSGLDSKDAQQVSQELAAAGITYEITSDGSGVQVPAESLDKARMEVAAKGMPQTGRLGFELFDKPNWVGSEFDERVNYQRALEGELEHTIGTISAVRSARVHLVLPQQSLFSGEQKAAKASVVLKLRDSSLARATGGVDPRAGGWAVEDLRPDQVMLADADGHLMLGNKSGTAEAEAHEAALAEKLIETLEPVAGTGNVRASVNVDYDTSTSEETDESYDPASVVTLSMQRSQQTATPAPAAKGVPGTASNAPNTQALQLSP